MRFLNHHFPFLPDRLRRLEDLAYNLWFSWHTEAVELFKEIDLLLWERTGRNPVRMLHEVDAFRLEELAENPAYVKKYDAVIQAFDHYLADQKTWFPEHYGTDVPPIAYFCMEFGIHECLPIYSGGLGILAGDLLKSASDLGVPMIGVGLLYREAYFTQQIALDGHQESRYVYNDFSNLPIWPVRNGNGELLVIRLSTDNRRIAAKVWQVFVGRVTLYLLDTDFPENAPTERRITERLYVADREMRLLQEILLGFGGVQVLRALGITPSVWHLNEGHCSFLTLERLKDLVQEGQALESAFEQVRSETVFTTHTPVPAGNEVFETWHIESHFKPFWESLGLSREAFLRFGQKERNPDPNAFNMTVLGLRFSRTANAVSHLHGVVSRRMWQDLYPDRSPDEVPIGAITNGIHTRTWMAGAMKDLLDRYLGPDWRYHLVDADYWEAVDTIPDEALWEVHLFLKQSMLDEIRTRLVSQRERNGESTDALREAQNLFNPDHLILGFARRFTLYKRGALLFRDRERLRNLLSNPDRPVQLVFAGKAHPADQLGQLLIQEIYAESRNPDFKGRIVFVEDYDMTLARHLVAGVDVWLNTPRRPLEASGTSGMKAATNGVLNMSVLDGWWREAYNDENGWAVGKDRDYYNEWEQDEADSQSLYNQLEHAVVPLYYTREEEGLPKEWIRRMKASMKSIIPRFNTHRMAQAYVTALYFPDPGESLVRSR